MRAKYTDPMIGRRLRMARKNVGMLQEAAATSLGFVRTTLIAIEKGERPIVRDELRDMAALYNVSEEWLLQGDKEDTPLLVNPEILKAMRQVEKARADMDAAWWAERNGLNALFDAVKKVLPKSRDEENES
jgi:transcriptional regulator with XRE-family HTH domain